MKVLFFAQPFPPGNFAAVPRTWNMARTLADSDCDVSVVTMRPDAWRYVNGGAPSHPRVRRIDVPPRWAFLAPWELKSSDRGVGRLAGGVARRVARSLGVDHSIGWKIGSERATANMTRDDVDVILATGSPFTSFSVAARLAARIKRPFVVDYRDLWNHNPHGRTGADKTEEERQILRDAAGVVAVSPSIIDVLDRQYGIGAKGHVLTNGYDDEELASIEPMRFGHFAIVYAGQFYPPKREPKAILDALRNLDVAGWKFHYAGPQPDLVTAAAAELGMSDRIVLHGNVSRRESLSLMAGASLALVIISVGESADASDRGTVTSKIFDIVGLRRPMLVVVPPGGDAETIVAGRTQTAFLKAQQQAEIVAFAESIARDGAPASAMPQLSWSGRGTAVRRILEDAAR